MPNKKKKKSIKQLQIGAFEGQSDFDRKIAQGIKWAEKGLEFRVKIQVKPSQARNLQLTDVMERIKDSLLQCSCLKFVNSNAHKFDNTSYKRFDCYIYFHNTCKKD